METMYPGKVNSPATTLDGGINNIVTTINIIDGSVLPVAPNIAVIGIGEDAETILYATKVVNVLSNITRGFQGVAKAWLTGETIARLFTEYDYNALKGNIATIAGRKITDFGECNSEELRGKITDETGSGKAVFGTYPQITKIDLTEGQIKFPAIVNASAEVNTLDDYEEGEFTPGIAFGGGTTGITYFSRGGWYTKIGKQVTASGYLMMTSKGSSTGTATITGLPFNSLITIAPISVVSLHLEHIAFANVFEGFLIEGNNKIIIHEVTEGGTMSLLNNTNFANNGNIILNVTYLTD